MHYENRSIDMAYLGYKQNINLYTKYLNDYEKVNMKVYKKIYKYVYKFLNNELSKLNLQNIIENFEINIITQDYLIYNLHNLIKSNIRYKQRLHRFISDNINNYKISNSFVVYLSLLYDDFLDCYHDNVVNDNNPYISLCGIFLNYSEGEFIHYIRNLLKDNIINNSIFSFLIEFLNKFVNFKNIHLYIPLFIDYYMDNLSSEEDDETEILTNIYNNLRIRNLNNNSSYFYKEIIKDKSTIGCVLKFLVKYIDCKFKGDYGKDQEFIDNLNLMYNLLKDLNNDKLNIYEYKIMINIYMNIVIKFSSDINIMKKIDGILKYMITSISEKTILYNNFTVAENVTIKYLCGDNYIEELSTDDYKSINYDILIYVLRIINSDNEDIIIRRVTLFVEKFKNYIIDKLKQNEIDNIVHYLTHIVNVMLKKDYVYYNKLYLVTNFILSNSRNNFYKLNYRLCKNIIGKSDSRYNLSFEGDSFYNKLISGNPCKYVDVRNEYIYGSNILLVKKDEILQEKIFLVNYFKDYLNSNIKDRAFYRNRYYSYLCKAKYFDLYKFDILDEFKDLNNTNILNKIDSECEFLIYNSPHEVGIKLGVILSLLFSYDKYMCVYSDIILKVHWGDIFYYVSNKYDILHNECLEHFSYVFKIKFMLMSKYKDRIFKNINFRNDSIYEEILTLINQTKSNLDLGVFIYLIVFSNYKCDLSDSVNMLTLKIKTLINIFKLIDIEYLDYDKEFYNKLKFYLKLYCKEFLSFTQFKILDELRSIIEDKLYKNYKIGIKDIDSYEKENTNNDKYSDLMKYIDSILYDNLSNDYFDKVIQIENVNLILDLIDNEPKLYSPYLKCIKNYILHNDKHNLEEIYTYGLINKEIIRVFLKILLSYPRILSYILNDKDQLVIYKRMVGFLY